MAEEGDRPDEEAARRQRALGLLEANHDFPGEFTLSVIAFDGDHITAAIVHATWQGQPRPQTGNAHQIIPSSKGKYVSHRLRVMVQSAHEVLDLFARVRAVEGVVTVL